ncbi:arylamine N-acetyltransferase, partial [Streptomyces galbus]|nr:arylamine N-acetyltransferase [Streptomyces galbus]
RLKVTRGDGAVEERELARDGEVLAAYREWFGIVLDRVPVVRGAERQGATG